jgi:hypothetical protein
MYAHINAVLAHPWFLYFAVPLLAVLLGIYLKYVTRNDHHKSFVKEDLAFGLELAVTALILFMTASVGTAVSAKSATDTKVKQALEDKLMSVPWTLLAFVLLIWGTSTLIRKFGWKDEAQLRVAAGIVLPDLLGVAVLLFVVNWIG